MSFEESSELPEGWAWAKLGDLGVWAGGGTPTTSVGEYWDNGTIPWISAKDMKADYLGTSQDSITEAGRAAARLTLLPPGSVLMVVRGMILARDFPVAVTTAAATINQDLRALIPSPAVDPRFLLRALQFVSGEVVQATGEATHGTRRLESDRLKAWPLPIPPLAEQRRIVLAVEQIFESVSSARERLGRVPTTIKLFRQAVLAAAGCGRLTADWRLANPDEFGEGETLDEAPIDGLAVPSSWKWLRSRNTFSFVTSGSRGWAKYYADSGAAFLRVGNLDHESIKLDMRSVQRVNPPRGAEGARTRVMKGDVLITITAEPGMVALVDTDIGEAYVNQHVALARPAGLLDSRFLAYFLAARTTGQVQFEAFQRGATKLGLGLDDIRSLWIASPPLAEQRQIVARIEQLLNLADAIEGRARATLKRVEMLTHAVLAKAFRGELVPTEAELSRREGRSYEPASELLARLKASTNGKEKRPRSRKSSKRVAASDENLLEFMEG